MKRFVAILKPLTIFILGITVGGYLFSDTRPRSFISFNRCNRCLSQAELTGLLGSVGIQRASNLLPDVIEETDKTIIIKYPLAESGIHYVVIPKKDIKDLGDLSEENQGFLIDAYALVGDLIRKEKLFEYKFYTNGPGYQAVGYLHFHLISK